MSTAIRIIIAAFVLALGGYFYLRAAGPAAPTVNAPAAGTTSGAAAPGSGR